MDKHEIFMLLAQQDQHLQYLIHGHQDFSRNWLDKKLDNHPVLQAWLLAHLRLDIQADHLKTLIPVEYYQLWQGWLAYRQGDYLAANAYFFEAWSLSTARSDSLVIAADAALGLGKVYTRSGHWSTARDWLLLSLQYYRQQQRLFGLVQGYGALGELMLRAGYPQAAHACMSTAHHLLPPGSGQQSRQLNYLASTLMRAQAWLRAESLLMSSLFMAKDNHDYDSQLHSIARLQFLALDRDADKADDMWERFVSGSEVLEQYVSVASGFLYVGRALRCQRLNQIDQAIMCLHKAITYHGLPCEKAWAQRLCFTLDSSCTYLLDSAVTQLLSLIPHTAPAVDSVVDYSWRGFPIVENGFSWLLQKQLSFNDLIKQRQSFFI